MKKKIACMLRLQDETNRRLAEDWKQRDWSFKLAAKVEAAELADHLSYKWWRLKKPDMPQARMEVVDIWHFVLSDLLRDAPNIATPSFIADTFRHAGDKRAKAQTPGRGCTVLHGGGRYIRYAGIFCRVVRCRRSLICRFVLPICRQGRVKPFSLAQRLRRRYLRQNMGRTRRQRMADGDTEPKCRLSRSERAGRYAERDRRQAGATVPALIRPFPVKQRRRCVECGAFFVKSQTHIGSDRLFLCLFFRLVFLLVCRHQAPSSRACPQAPPARTK